MRFPEIGEENCSIARTLAVLGERWTLLILRQSFLGVKRFDELQRTLGIARNVLADRLQTLVGEGVLERRRYQDRPPRYEYRLTERGLDLHPVIFSLMKWGDKHAAPNGPPRLTLHRGCGGEIDDYLTCSKCGARVTARQVEARPGPGLEVPAAWV